MSTLGEHQGNGIRFDMHLSAPNGGVAQMLCRPEGQWVSWNEYEKLKAEVERLQHLANQSEFYRSQLQKDTCRLENIQMQDAFKHYEAENARLKDEVERLRKFNDEALAHIAKEERKSRERLDMAEAEVERLRKAGDALAETLEGAGFDSAMDFWNAAKEGKLP